MGTYKKREQHGNILGTRINRGLFWVIVTHNKQM